MSNYKFEETRDGEIIRSIVMQPDIKEFMFDVYVPSDASLNMSELHDKQYTFYKLEVNGKAAGIVSFTKSDDIAIIDVAIVPQFRGKDALKFATDIFNTYSQNHNVIDFFGKVRRNNKRCLVFCKWCGFSIYKSDGKFHYVRRQWAVH